MENLIREILLKVGENPVREGLLKTPERVARSMEFLMSGYKKDPVEILKGALFEEKYDEMVIVKDIEIYSMCEHHMLPFYGKCHVAYIPNGKIVGLSKIPRVVDVFARRLQVQERLTCQIAEVLMDVLNPLGVACVVDAVHLCMVMRGVEKQHSHAVTSSMLGVFRNDAKARGEFLSLIGVKR